MADEQAFLRTIRDHPGDEAPKLVYADWLDERGDPRGELIRLACEMNYIRRRLSTIPARIAELSHLVSEDWIIDVFGRFRVVLTSFPHGNMVPVAKAIHQVTDYSLRESKELAEVLPAVIVDGVPWDIAQRVCGFFAECASVRVEPSGRTEPFPRGAPFAVQNFRIILRSHLNGAKLQTIKALRSLTGLTTAAARELCDTLPRVLCERVPFSEVERFRAALRPFAEIDAVPMDPPY
jgi:uncharacterized protein (TIGR02996 family)